MRALPHAGHTPRCQTRLDGQARGGLLQRRGGVAAGVHHQQHGAGQAHELFSPLGVPAQPKKMLCRAAGHGPMVLGDVVHAQAFGQHRESVHRAIGHHPGVEAGAPALHGHAGLLALRHARHAAGQNKPATLAICHGVNTQLRRARRDGAGPPQRRPRQRQTRLQCPGIGVLFNQAGCTLMQGRRTSTPRESAAHQLVVHVVAHGVPSRCFTAPPSGQAG